MPSTNPAANWALLKRVLHWGIAVAVVTALLVPKPEHGEGLVHMAAGTTALALVLVRVAWRVIGGVKPALTDALRLRLPDASRGARAFAPLALQGARLLGFALMLAIVVAVGLAVTGIGQGEDSAALEAHEAAGTTIMVLAIAHAAAVLLFALLMKYDLIGVTLFGAVGKVSGGGARGAAGLALGAALAAASVFTIWGPMDVAGKAAAMQEQGEHGEAGARGEDD
ncbi:MAG: hypothetical protein JNJ63_10800 [Hyphomonadaceae bacterium]|nr:hypothetical protein [Hyphomonadaceae bacterium]